MSTARVVIVGSGIAGITAAESLRAAGFTGPVTVIGEEPALPYRRTALSKDLLAADLSDDKIRLRKPEFWAERDIEIITDCVIAQIDADAREAVAGDGRRFAYDALVLATGGRPRSVDAVDPAVPTLRHHADALTLQERLAGQPVVVIGGGLIGLEIAASAAAAPSPVASPARGPCSRLRWMVSRPIGPTGAAIDRPTSSEERNTLQVSMARL